MKRRVKRLDEAVVLRDYPTVVGELPGWFFRAGETSNNGWLGEGIDLWGRRVSHRGDGPDAAVAAAVDAARVVQAHLASASS